MKIFPQSETFKASFYAVLAFAFFAFGDAMGKWLQDDGFNRFFILTITQIPGLIIMFAYMMVRHGWGKTFKRSLVKWHLIRAMFIVFLTFFLFMAVQNLPLANLYGIIFCAPFFTAIGAALFFKEKQTKVEWVAILTGFTGILFITDWDYSSFNIAYLYALGQALSISGGALMVRKIGRDEHPFVFVIYANIAVIAFNCIPMMYHSIPNLTLFHYGLLAIYSVVLPLAIMFLTMAFTTTPRMTAVLPYQYTQIVWGTFIGILVFNNVPGWNVFFGAGIIIGCGLFLIFYQSRQKRKQRK